MTLFWLIGSLAVVLGAFALVPVLIHLINMMRHRRVQWAAMDFLLASYRKHRNWIWLKQVLLLLFRVTAMVLLALILCAFVHLLMNHLRSRLGMDEAALSGLFGGKTTHHYVIVDDSYSMSDRFGGMTAFEGARKTIATIARRAAHQDHQRFTLIRFSRGLANTTSDDQEQIVDSVDLNAVDVDRDFAELLEERRNQIDVSELSVGPSRALEVVRQLVEQREDEKAVVYVISDFRAKEWDNPAEFQKSLEALRAFEAEIQLVSCVDSERQNLAITNLEPENETRAAGVPLFINVTVKNFGTQPAQKVQVKVRSIFFDPDDALAGHPELVHGQAEELPTVLFEQIPAGDSATSRIQVFFPEPGKHVVEAMLQDDAVPTDNRRWCVVDFLPGVPVLIIDGSSTRRSGYFLAAAFDPDGRKNTGIRPEVQSVGFLRDTASEVLARYQTVYLSDVNIDQLNESAIKNLEDYVRSGGGLGVFVGPNVNLASYNERLYRNGEGLFPVPLDMVGQLDESVDKKLPDIVASEHPVFQAIMGERNPLINLVAIQQYLKPPSYWHLGDHPDVTVVARLRNGDLLAAERRFGDGHVVAILTTLGPDWHNWTRNPTFVVLALKLQAHLSSGRRRDLPRVTGAPIVLQFDAERYRKEVTFVVPGSDKATRTTIDRQARRPTDDSPLLEVALGGHRNSRVVGGETARSGTYEAWAYTTDGSIDVQRFAVNVDNSEGDLALADSKVLLTKLEKVKPVYVHWDQLSDDPIRQAGFNWGKWILLALVGLLVLEQMMAYSLSYHPSRGAVP